jgi:diacylglycerol kinase (ATP)
MQRKSAVIVNPAAANGRAGRAWPLLADRLRAQLGNLAVRLTESPGHATRIARELAESGFDLMIVVGGDGTISEVANGILQSDRPLGPGLQLGILPAGTGGDLRRSLGIPASPREAIEVIVQGQPLAIDVGKASLVARGGSAVQRYFVNLASFGLGGDVAAAAKNRLTVLGGKTAFLWATLKGVATFRGREVEMELDGGSPRRFFVSNVAVGNGRYHGGGMQPCPRARMDDGLLDVTVIDYMTPLEVLGNIHVLYSDDVYRLPKVHRLQTRRLRAQADQLTLVELDGEPVGHLPIEIEILPRRLNVLLSP